MHFPQRIKADFHGTDCIFCCLTLASLLTYEDLHPSYPQPPNSAGRGPSSSSEPHCPEPGPAAPHGLPRSFAPAATNGRPSGGSGAGEEEEEEGGDEAPYSAFSRAAGEEEEGCTYFPSDPSAPELAEEIAAAAVAGARGGGGRKGMEELREGERKGKILPYL